MKEEELFDVIIIGGSYAGLSAAMALGRAVREVLIIDNGNPCNKTSPHAHNFITWDGAKPSEISAKAKQDVLRYPTVKFINETVKDATKLDSGFQAITEKEETFKAKKLLFATGITDLFPEIKNLSECWGLSVLHCPYCHGYEVKNKKTAVLANGDHAFEVCMVLTHWTKEIIILTNGTSTLTEAQIKKLKEHNIGIIDKEIEEVAHKNGLIENIYFKDKSKLSIPVIYAKLPFKQHCNIPEKLGCEFTEDGYIKTDTSKKTTVAGIYAAGDNTRKTRTISIAIAAGTTAGMMLNGELIAENFGMITGSQK